MAETDVVPVDQIINEGNCVVVSIVVARYGVANEGNEVVD